LKCKSAKFRKYLDEIKFLIPLLNINSQLGSNENEILVSFNVSLLNSWKLLFPSSALIIYGRMLTAENEYKLLKLRFFAVQKIL
jgi:hypothetical protein